MYAEHMPILRAHGLASPKGLADLVTFTVLSIRQPFMRMPEHWKVTSEQGEASPHLWGWKLDSYRFIHSEQGNAVWLAATQARTAPQCIKALIPTPGLGIVKSAFVAQMLGHHCACFDSRNIRVLGHDKRKWRYDADYSDGLLDFKISEYCALSRELGAEYWWNAWCESVARDNGVRPGDVSAIHLEAVK